ncbi:hypothetical protein NDU88_000783 [Pleurodeles waltl]|uniref:Uncharacterized protein n=1 Tax=Pleurodeles waltl TaxID=8319 RepID=A0AAV7S5J0_PLEWA|nr:hypothetical protein NDU88_000783 [Pleurodeles waltl]
MFPLPAPWAAAPGRRVTGASWYPGVHDLGTAPPELGRVGYLRSPRETLAHRRRPRCLMRWMTPRMSRTGFRFYSEALPIYESLECLDRSAQMRRLGE